MKGLVKNLTSKLLVTTTLALVASKEVIQLV